ncbi:MULTISPECIES: RNA polymerase sigma factor [Sphingobium]|jgi:RNA polymerase sigma factor (sigma-70 family)|uniref:Uncharacterized protein n=3 Tax=Sphingobium TaxID=165695 RepID=T0HK97_9SPHN|nr:MULTISPECIES: sigma-70 family RNA polymerase sigma factor [Sphingobium]EQB16751.1 hypothetical protein RLDS_06435 [Sphingobium lactosutens DS20]QDC36602.1 RNA polymerase sigma factor [Sphingobium fuliginis ATCC 27551]QNG43913.1 RNA polymerase sigma factor [Sphingobium yanoikuyae]
MDDGSRHRQGIDSPAEESRDSHLDQSVVAKLLATFEADYPILLHRLSHRLRSQEAAQDALHDAYVKLRSQPDVKEVRNHRAYLYRMSLNLAKNSIRHHGRTSTVDDYILALVPDLAPDPEQVAIARLEMEHMFAALHRMSQRRRQVFLARWRDGKSQAEIALEFGLHKRSVQKELMRAEVQLRKVLRRPKS